MLGVETEELYETIETLIREIKKEERSRFLLVGKLQTIGKPSNLKQVNYEKKNAKMIEIL